MRFDKRNDVLGTVNRGNPTESGLCTLCRADCEGKCETWVSSLMGRKVLYPRDAGMVTVGPNNTTHVGVSYNALRIQAHASGAHGRNGGLPDNPGDGTIDDVDLTTEFGFRIKTKARIPLMVAPPKSTGVAGQHWHSLAIGCALVGVPIVIGDDVVETDRESEIRGDTITKAPALDRRIESYMRYYNGHGAVILQLNAADTRNAVAVYAAEKHGGKCIIELIWGGEILTAAPRRGSWGTAPRHSGIDLMGEAFLRRVAHLRSLGFQRIALKTGAYGMQELAMAIKFATDAELDLLTIDGSGNDNGIRPWNMMQTWGIPSILLHAKAHEYAGILAAKGQKAANLAFAGGFALEDGIFKALALGAPYAKIVRLGRTGMIPGFLGANIEGVLLPERKEAVGGLWERLPRTVGGLGAAPEQIFAGYGDVEKMVGKNEMKHIPYGAMAFWTLADKLSLGLRHLLAGAKKLGINEIHRDDLFAANRETAMETGISHCTDANDVVARAILDG